MVLTRVVSSRVRSVIKVGVSIDSCEGDREMVSTENIWGGVGSTHKS